jgi:class 3 adenylate cyclase
MPDLADLAFGEAKRMSAAALFFDFKDFTAITSTLAGEATLYILDVTSTALMKIVRNWGGVVEKHTGDGVMAILGSETAVLEEIARDGLEAALAMRYVMLNDVQPKLVSDGLPAMNFRIGMDMGELLISRIGLRGMSFLTAIGSAANRASKLQSLAEVNGICLGNNLAANLHPASHRGLRLGADPRWNWLHDDGRTPYHFYHYDWDWPSPSDWIASYSKNAMEWRRRYRV